MWRALKVLIPGRQAWRRLVVAAGFAGVAVLAFCWGRHGGLSEAKATPPGGDPFVEPLPLAPVSSSDYSRRVVAYIHNNIPITREDLGEYLIARFGAERVDFLVNHRIIEHACQARNIQITDAEISAQLNDDLKIMGNLRLEDFEKNVLKRFNKTLFEYREDVIRPKLALAKFCREHVTVTTEDMKNAFEAKFGDKVKCRMIVLAKEAGRHSAEVYMKVRDDDAAFDHEARQQFVPALAANGGLVPPIHHHFGDAQIEREAFNLKPGEVSSVLGMSDGTFVILKCVEHVPADTTKRMEDVHEALYKEIFDQKLAQEIPKIFQELRKQAAPVVFLRKQASHADVERIQSQAMGAAGAGGAPAQVSAPPSQVMPLPAVTGPKTTPPQGN